MSLRVILSRLDTTIEVGSSDPVVLPDRWRLVQPCFVLRPISGCTVISPHTPLFSPPSIHCVTNTVHEKGYHLSIQIEKRAMKGPLITWDTRKAQVSLYSHPLGRGTFFYVILPDKVILSTSLVDVAVLLDQVDLCRQMVAEYLLLLRCSSTQQNLTFINGISQLPPGCRLDWQAGGLKISPYWQPLQEPFFEALKAPEAAEQVRFAVQEALAEQALPQRVGCLVSGGLDSSVVAAAVKTYQERQGGETLLLSLKDNLDSPEEQQLQQALAHHLGLALTPLSLRRPHLQMDRLRAINHHANSPSGGLFTGIYHDVVEIASTMQIPLLIGGEGGDELFSANSQILADYLMRGNWRALAEGVGFFSSIFYNTDSLSTFIGDALLPMLQLERTRYYHRWAINLLSRFTGRTSEQRAVNFLSRLIGEFAHELPSAHEANIQDMVDRLKAGFSFASYSSYRQVIEMPNYEIAGTQSHPSIYNPLGNIHVFNAAMSLKLEERVGTWLGFRPKYLLSLAAGTSIPQSIAYHPKIGRSNLVAQVTLGIEEEVATLLDNAGFHQLGINIPPYYRDPRHWPVNVSLYWAWLLRLAIWFEELLISVNDYGRPN